jgi:Fur family transcriptional regulator, peroxide stress response regulator
LTDSVLGDKIIIIPSINLTYTKYKRSRQRERLLELLRSTKEHPTATWLYDRLKREFPDLSLGTVYRNLGVLRDQGLLRVLAAGSTFDRFDADTSTHYHFLCERCGSVEDLPLPADPGIELAASSTGRIVKGHRIDVFGLCETCAKPEAFPNEAAAIT